MNTCLACLLVLPGAWSLSFPKRHLGTSLSNSEGFKAEGGSFNASVLQVGRRDNECAEAGYSCSVLHENQMCQAAREINCKEPYLGSVMFACGDSGDEDFSEEGAVVNCVTAAQHNPDSCPGGTNEVSIKWTGSNWYCYCSTLDTCTPGGGAAAGMWKIWGVSSASAHGDPHVQNMKGEKFDVLQTGKMTFLQIPQGASEESTLLRLLAKIDLLGTRACESLFITQITMDGLWLGQDVKFRAGRLGSREPFGMQVGDGPWVRHGEIFIGYNITVAQQQSGEVWYPSTTLPVRALKDQRNVGISVTFGKMVVEISQVKNKNFVFLDLGVHGLAGLPTTVGGLLGHDDHTQVSTKPDNCVSKKFHLTDQYAGSSPDRGSRAFAE